MSSAILRCWTTTRYGMKRTCRWSSRRLLTASVIPWSDRATGSARPSDRCRSSPLSLTPVSPGSMPSRPIGLSTGGASSISRRTNPATSTTRRTRATRTAFNSHTGSTRRSLTRWALYHPPSPFHRPILRRGISCVAGACGCPAGRQSPVQWGCLPCRTRTLRSASSRATRPTSGSRLIR